MLRSATSRMSTPIVGRWLDLDRQASAPASMASATHSSSILMLRRRIVAFGTSWRHSRMRSRASSGSCISSTRTTSGCCPAIGRRTLARPSSLPRISRPAELRRASRMVSMTNELSATSTRRFKGFPSCIWGVTRGGLSPALDQRVGCPISCSPFGRAREPADPPSCGGPATAATRRSTHACGAAAGTAPLPRPSAPEVRRPPRSPQRCPSG